MKLNIQPLMLYLHPVEYIYYSAGSNKYSIALTDDYPPAFVEYIIPLETLFSIINCSH